MTTAKPKKISADTVKLIESMVRRCMNELKKKQYELGITKADVDYAVKVTRVVRRATGGATYAGANAIQINLSYWQHRSEKAYHEEYDSFDKDPVIGGMVTYNMNDNLLMSVAHEVAHHVQRRKCRTIARFSKTHRKPHGDCFKWVYRQLRATIVNPAVEESRKAWVQANTVKMPVTIHAKSELFAVLSKKMDKRRMPSRIKNEWLQCQSLAKGKRVTAELLGHIIGALDEANRSLFYKSQLQIVGKRSVTKKRYLAGRRIKKQLTALAV